MGRYEIRLGGLGGQGIILAGVVIGRAAAVYAGMNAVMGQSYGPEARGGASRSEVIISDEEIDYPRTLEPDLLAVMSQAAYEKYIGDLKPGGILVIDPDLVKVDDRAKKASKIYAVPATRIAESLGRRIVANMVLVGALTAITKLVPKEAMENSVKASVPPGTEALNLRAFNTGYEYGLRLLKEGEVEVKA